MSRFELSNNSVNVYYGIDDVGVGPYIFFQIWDKEEEENEYNDDDEYDEDYDTGPCLCTLYQTGLVIHRPDRLYQLLNNKTIHELNKLMSRFEKTLVYEAHPRLGISDLIDILDTIFDSYDKQKVYNNLD